MKILLISPYLPHPHSGHGGGEYVYGLLTHLARQHEVTLVTFADAHEQQRAASLGSLPVRIHLIPRKKDKQPSIFGNLSLAVTRILQFFRSIIRWEPYYISKYRNARLAAWIRRETSKQTYDVIQIEFAQMAQYADCVRGAKIVLREHDVMFRPAYRLFHSARGLFRRTFAYIEFCRWARYEPRVVRRFDHVLTFTAQDADLLKRLSDFHNVSYVPRGIEVPEVIPAYESRTANSILFVGVFSHRPNVNAVEWLCAEIYPQIISRYPQATLTIIGRDPPPSVHKLARRFASVRVTGFVESIEEFYSTLSVSVAPVRIGGGIRTKILHAQSFGMPVVTTPLGAEGIEGAALNTMVIERTTEGFVDAVIRLLKDRRQAAAMGARGRESAIRHYSWDSVARTTTELYRKLISNTSPTEHISGVGN